MAIVSTKPNVKNAWAETGSRIDATPSKRSQGWIQEIPTHEMANGIEYNQDLAIKYLFQEGVAIWDNTFEYSETSWTKYAGILYRAKRANNDKQPDINPLDWEIPYLRSVDVVPTINSKADKSTIIEAGVGLYGGGDLSTNRTININTSVTPLTTSYLGTIDLNTVVTYGYYYQDTNTNATSARNYPIQLAGSLEIYRTAGIIQEYTTYGSSKRKFIRGYYNNQWSEWSEILTNLSIGTTAGTVAAGNDSRIINGQAAYTNLIDKYDKTGGIILGDVDIVGQAFVREDFYVTGDRLGLSNNNGTTILLHNSGVDSGVIFDTTENKYTFNKPIYAPNLNSSSVLGFNPNAVWYSNTGKFNSTTGYYTPNNGYLRFINVYIEPAETSDPARIEVSPNGTSWLTVAQIKGAGANRTSPTLSAIIPPNYYYRLVNLAGRVLGWNEFY